MTIDELIERAVSHVAERLAGVVISEPAYAVGFYSGDDAALDVSSIAIGIEVDRQQWKGEVDADEERFLIWNPHEYSVELPDVPPLAEIDEVFAAGQEAALTELLERDVLDPQHYVYTRIAARVDPASLPFARTN